MAILRCPRCNSALVEISFTLRDEPMLMRSCSKCDRRWWHRGDQPVDLNAAFAPPAAAPSASDNHT